LLKRVVLVEGVKADLGGMRVVANGVTGVGMHEGIA